LNSELRKSLTQAGGAQVWIKRHPSAENETKVDSVVEILVTPEAFDRVISAFRAEATKRELAIEIRPEEKQNAGRTAEIRLGQGKRPLGQWRVREVQRLLRAAIIIDDLGQDLEAANALLAMSYPLTFSVLPELPHSQRIADEAFRKGREVMLHLPMEPQPGAPTPPGPGEIRIGMTGREAGQIVEADLSAVPHVRGVNNHMGSRATADPALMAAVMSVLAKHRLFFVDSRTTAASTGLAVARRMGVPASYRSVFLDDTETVAYSLGQLRQFRREIEQKGAAIAIGHPHPTTIEALAEFLPQLERDDIQLVPASELVHLPEVSRLTPAASHALP
jgi:polysaccharide deacetylase 2 family uncharacterized protein YibQ